MSHSNTAKTYLGPLSRAYTVCLVFAQLILSACGGSQGPSTGVHAIAVSGDPAPGLPTGYLFEGIDVNYTLGASGQVLFSGSANVERGGAGDRKKVLWFGLPDALVPIAETGQAVPGTDDAVIADFSPLPRIVTQSGRSAFIVRQSAYPRGYSPQALLAYHKGTLSKVIASGDRVPTPDGAGTLLTINQFVMTDAGLLLMGTYARRQSALWFWDFSTLKLVIAEGTEIDIGDFVCKVRSLESTTLDMNRSGFALFRASTFGNQCLYGGTVGWDQKSAVTLALAMNREAIAPGSSDFFESTTGDARISDNGEIALHAEIYSTTVATSARSMTMLQPVADGPTVGLLDKNTPIDDAPNLKLTHALHANGMAPLGDGELVHFVRNNRDRIILRTQLDRQPRHSLVAHQGSALDDSIAARIGNAAVNRDGDVVFTSFIDDDKPGGTYEQQLWLAERNGTLRRIAYAGLTIVGRGDATLAHIDASNQSHEPTMVSTQGGRSRTISDAGYVVFAGSVREASRQSKALLLASF